MGIKVEIKCDKCQARVTIKGKVSFKHLHLTDDGGGLIYQYQIKLRSYNEYLEVDSHVFGSDNHIFCADCHQALSRLNIKATGDILNSFLT